MAIVKRRSKLEVTKKENARKAIDMPRIKIVGIGDGAGNIINRIMKESLLEAEHIVINTDEYALAISTADVKIQIEIDVNDQLIEEVDREQVAEVIRGTDLLLIIACLGGVTGISVVPVIADIAHSNGVTTTAIVTTPFHMEGSMRKAQAANGIELLRNSVDNLVIIHNEEYKSSASSLADVFALIDHAIVEEIRTIANGILPR